MVDFLDAVYNVLDEKDLNVEILFDNNIISKNTFYKYRKRNPSLQTLIKIANFLEVSIDYLFELCNENHFSRYKTNQNHFYDKLCDLINKSNLSQREFCRRMNYSKANILRYKNGVEPSIRTLLEVSQFFNCQIDELLDKE